MWALQPVWKAHYICPLSFGEEYLVPFKTTPSGRLEWSSIFPAMPSYPYSSILNHFRQTLQVSQNTSGRLWQGGLTARRKRYYSLAAKLWIITTVDSFKKPLLMRLNCCIALEYGMGTWTKGTSEQGERWVIEVMSHGRCGSLTLGSLHFQRIGWYCARWQYPLECHLLLGKRRRMIWALSRNILLMRSVRLPSKRANETLEGFFVHRPESITNS